MATVDHDGQLHGPGPPEIVEGVEGGPDGPTGEEHVVDQHDHLAGQVTGDVGHRLGEDRSQPDVVAVEGDVEAAQDDLGALDLAQHLGHAGGQRDTAGLQADQDHVLDAAVALDDLVRHPGQGALHVGRGENLGVGHEHAPEGPRVTALAFGHCSSCPCEPHGTHFTVRRCTLAAPAPRNERSGPPTPRRRPQLADVLGSWSRVPEMDGTAAGRQRGSNRAPSTPGGASAPTRMLRG